jgi:hypothetical protein
MFSNLGENKEDLIKEYFPIYYSYRMINHFELSDKLRQLEKRGIIVPRLNMSEYMPIFSKRDGENEVYGNLIVKPGFVIDSHGNIVNLAALEKQLMEKPIKS